MRILLTLTIAMLALAGCENPPTRQQTGAVLGGVIGGVIGSEVGHRGTAATIIGTLAGAAIGASIGRTMDESDRRRTAHVLEHTPVGHAGHWVNPDTGAAYRVTPTRTFDHHGTPCREYTLDAASAAARSRCTAPPAARPTAAGARRPTAAEAGTPSPTTSQTT
jgi:surface antigen